MRAYTGLVQARGASSSVGNIPSTGVRNVQRQDRRVEDNDEVFPKRCGHGPVSLPSPSPPVIVHLRLIPTLRQEDRDFLRATRSCLLTSFFS